MSIAQIKCHYYTNKLLHNLSLKNVTVMWVCVERVQRIYNLQCFCQARDMITQILRALVGEGTATPGLI